MQIKVVIIDDHGLVRAGLVALLKDHLVIKVIGEAQERYEALELCLLLSPDVIVLDINLPLANELDFIQQIHRLKPSARIVALLEKEESSVVSELLRAGASSVLTKNCTANDLIKAIQEVCLEKASPTTEHSGQTYSLNNMASYFSQQGYHLTIREQEVLQLIAKGNSSKEIAKALQISLNTVVRHRQNITAKLGINGIAELTRYALQKGLITL
jgi:DNA-binding NarL/FixJ family response regulator